MVKNNKLMLKALLALGVVSSVGLHAMDPMMNHGAPEQLPSQACDNMSPIAQGNLPGQAPQCATCNVGAFCFSQADCGEGAGCRCVLNAITGEQRCIGAMN